MRTVIQPSIGGKYVAWEVDHTWCIAHVDERTGEATTMAYSITEDRMRSFLANVSRPAPVIIGLFIGGPAPLELELGD